VLGQRFILSQVLFALPGNAIKLVAPGSRSQVLIQTEHRDALVRVTVGDNGIVLETRYTERMFRAFERLGGCVGVETELRREVASGSSCRRRGREMSGLATKTFPALVVEHDVDDALFIRRAFHRAKCSPSGL
jgi:hypothetical protein